MSLISHQREWSNCSQCNLYKTRHKVCIYRGRIPCDVLFLGEAPGLMEDINGTPFVGPAGQLLDKCIIKAKEEVDAKWCSDNDQRAEFNENMPPEIQVGFTNLIACIPKDSYSSPIRPPSPSEIQACSERLKETITLASPKVIIAVGKLAEEYLKKNYLYIIDYREVIVLYTNGDTLYTTLESIIHPSAILRSDAYSSQVDALTQRLYEIFLRYFG